MRKFSWDCFQVTGSVDAYLLYKDLEPVEEIILSEREESMEEELES